MTRDITNPPPSITTHNIEENSPSSPTMGMEETQESPNTGSDENNVQNLLY